MKKLVLLATAVLFALGLGLGAAVAKDAPKGPIKVTNYGKKDPVIFDHSKHSEIDCKQCHHMADEGKYKCGDCHKAKEEGDAPSFKDAAHKKDMGKCYECHYARGAEHKLKCGDCHKG